MMMGASVLNTDGPSYLYKFWLDTRYDQQTTNLYIIFPSMIAAYEAVIDVFQSLPLKVKMLSAPYRVYKRHSETLRLSEYDQLYRLYILRQKGIDPISFYFQFIDNSIFSLKRRFDSTPMRQISSYKRFMKLNNSRIRIVVIP